MEIAANNVIIVCKEDLYKGSAEDLVTGLKTIPTGLNKAEMKQHMNFINDTAKDILVKCEKERGTALAKIHLQERKLEDLRNEHVNIVDDNELVDKIMTRVECYSECRMLKASIRRRKNLNKMLSEDEVKTIALEKEKLREIESKYEATKDVITWIQQQIKSEDKVIDID